MPNSSISAGYVFINPNRLVCLLQIPLYRSYRNLHLIRQIVLIHYVPVREMMLQRSDEFFIAIIFILRLGDIPLDAVPLDTALGTLRIDIRGERVERVLEEDGFRLRRLEFAKDAGTAVSDIAPILILFLLFQLDRRQVDDGISVAGEDA